MLTMRQWQNDHDLALMLALASRVTIRGGIRAGIHH